MNGTGTGIVDECAQALDAVSSETSCTVERQMGVLYVDCVAGSAAQSSNDRQRLTFYAGRHSDWGVIQWPARAARGLSVWLGLVLASVCICFVNNYLNRLGRRVAV